MESENNIENNFSNTIATNSVGTLYGNQTSDKNRYCDIVLQNNITVINEGEIDSVKEDSIRNDLYNELCEGSINSGNKNFNVNINSRQLNCMYTNTRSIMNMNKLDEIQLILNENKIDILGISESWTHDNIEDAEVMIPGYLLFRRDRVFGVKKRGGGVLLYIKDDLHAVDISDGSIGGNESLWISIKGENNKHITIGVCYRGTSASIEEENNLKADIKHFSRNNALIMGDFNYGEINWESLHAGSHYSDLFMKVVNDAFLTQHVLVNTRRNSILDLILSSEPDMVEDLLVSSPIANSDHCVIYWKLIFETQIEKNSMKMFNYHKGDYGLICSDLDKVDWDNHFQDRGVEAMWNFFVTKTTESRDRHVPIREIKSNGNPKWLKKSLITKIKSRSNSWKKFKDNPSFDSEAKYKRLRNSITSDIRKAKKEYENKLAEKIKTDPKSFYSYIRSKSQTKVKIGPLRSEQGELVEGSEGMGQILNKYFASVFTKENMEYMPEPVDNYDIKGRKLSLETVDITQEKIVGTVVSLQDNKAAGIDGFNSTFIKRSINGVSKPLSRIFSKSLSTGIIPLDWKLANVNALFKKGSKKEPGNYRPISLTSQICKMMERLIKNEIVDYLESNKLIQDSQHGFRKGRSCLTNVLEFLQFTSNKVDRREPVDVIYLDFQKAFDTVPHRRLVLKLKALGIGGNLLRWIDNWLSNRKQRVVLNGINSEWVDVTSGVPQGSVLGPILFIIFINDLDDGVLSKILKFADDTKMMGSVRSEEDVKVLRDDLAKLFKWSEVWQMKFNIDKCKIMHIGYKNPGAKYEVNGKELDVVKNEKDLGIVISDDLKVATQCGIAAKKGYQILGLISRTFLNKNATIIIKLYKSLVRPHLDYCSQAWRPYMSKDIDILERVQRRATKMVQECKGLDYNRRLKKVGLTTLETRRLRADMIEVYKIVNELDNIKESTFFRRASSCSAYTTRGNSLKLFQEYVRLDVAKYSFGNRVVHEWNQLPNKVVQASSLDTFKGRLDHFLGHTRGLI